MKQSQKQIVLKHMRETGSVSRNWALQNYISRLSAIMLDLKNEGVNFETRQDGGDYVYSLLDKPQKVVYRVNGEIVATKTIW